MECYTRLYAAATPNIKFSDLPIYDKSSTFYLDHEISEEDFELIVVGIFKEYKIKKIDRAPFRTTLLLGCAPKFKVKLKQFSNHDGFKEGQIENAIEEFEEVVQAYLLELLVGEYYQDGLLQTVDYVNYEIL